MGVLRGKPGEGGMAVARTVAVVGGDRRQEILAEKLREDGWKVTACCLGEGSLPLEAAGECGIVILPCPVTRDGKTLHAPLWGREVALDDGFARRWRGKRVFAGGKAALERTSPFWSLAEVWDYGQEPGFLVGNGYLTAEAAAALAILEHPGRLGGSRVLVTGYGNVGKALCLVLRGLGARVDCCARRREAREELVSLGCGALGFGPLEKGYEVIFNTVPARVLTREALGNQRPGTLLVELASAPGGIDREAAGELGLRVVDGPGLPGRFAPEAAAELTRQAILELMEKGGALREERNDAR